MNAGRTCPVGPTLDMPGLKNNIFAIFKFVMNNHHKKAVVDLYL